MDLGDLKPKIRHFLLQNSEIYKCSLKTPNKDLNISQIAKELQKKCGIGERRLRRYLPEDTNSKALSITAQDLNCFRILSNQSFSDFFSYLVGLNQRSSHSWWQNNILDFFDGLENCTIFYKKNHKKSTRLLKILISAIQLDDSGINHLDRYVQFLRHCKNSNQLNETSGIENS